MVALLGRYELVDELGRGASGRVLCAMDLAAGRSLRALKVVAAEEAGRLVWEFARLAQVEGPGIARVRELLRVPEALPPPFSLAAGDLVLVEDLAEGQTLSALLEGTPRDQRARVGGVLKIGIALAEALSRIHDAGLVHGDVKPENVIANPDGSGVVLVDLGFARPPALEAIPRGTPSYMAPELLGGVCSPAADVYALGALLFDLLAGRPAPSGLRGSPWPQREVAQLGPDLPPALAQVLGALLEADPAARPADGRAALVALLPVAQLLQLPEAASAIRHATLAALPAPDERAARIRRLPFVGREALVSRLSEHLGRSGVVLVRGLSGSGKSRLIREAIRHLQSQCVREGRAAPSWVTSLEGLLALQGSDAILWLEEEERLPARLAAAQACGLGIRSLAVVVECGPGREVREAASIDVGPLDDTELETLLARALAPDRPSQALLRAASQASQALAGRLCELVAQAVQRGRELRDGRAFEGLVPSRSTFQLSPAADRLAAMLAWVGPALSPDQVAAVLGGQMQAALAFDELAAQGLVVTEARGARLAFGVARQVRARSFALRREVATWLGQDASRRRVPREEACPDSGFWLFAQGHEAAAIRALCAEARALRARGEVTAAQELLAEAHELLPDPELARGLADALRAEGRYQEALSVLGAHSDAPALCLRAEVARLMGQTEQAMGWIEAVLSDPAPALHAQARAIRARLWFDRGEPALAQADVERVRQSRDEEALVRALEVEVLLALGASRPAAAACDQLVRRAHALGSARAQSRALALRAQARLLEGRRAAARDDVQEALARARAAGEAHEAASFALNLGLVYLEDGELGPALATLREAAYRLSSIQRPQDFVRVLFNLAALSLLLGDEIRADVVLSQAEARLADSHDHAARGLVAVLRAELQWRTGALPVARRTLEAALDQVPEGARAVRCVMGARLAQLAAAAGDGSRGERALQEAQAALPSEDRVAALELHTAQAAVALARGALQEALDSVALGRALADHGAPFAERLRFMLTACEVARAAHDQPLLHACSVLCRQWLESALRSLPTHLRSGVRAQPDYARVLSAAGRVPSPAPDSAGRWRALVQASRRLFDARHPRRVLQCAADTALDLIHAERAFVIACGAQGELTELARSALVHDREVPQVYSRSIVERVLASGQPLLTIDAGTDPLLASAKSLRALSVRSVLALPLAGWAEPALLYLDDRLRSEAFDDEDLALLTDWSELTRQALATSEALQLQRRRARVAEQRETRLTRVLSRDAARPRSPPSGLIGRDPQLLRVVELAKRVAVTAVPVLVAGESGTGKELLARYLHQASARARGPFVAESCAAMPASLLESALFGHVRGAFTGADRPRKGLFDLADGGTLFLDEVAEMTPALQAKLLRVLQEGEFRPVGSERLRRVDVRVIAATRRSLPECVAQGSFREDLYYRLAVVTLELPPLRARRGDFPLLLAHFVQKHAPDAQVTLTPDLVAALSARPYPGNVRQLENEVRRALALGEGELRLEDFDGDARSAGGSDAGLGLHAQVEALTRRLVDQALAQTAGNITQAAQLLGISRFGLQKILKRYEAERARR